MMIDQVNEFTPWHEARAVQMGAAVLAAKRAAALQAYRKEWAAAGVEGSDIDVRNWRRIPTLSKAMLVAASADEGCPFGRRLGVERAQLAKVFVAPGPLHMPFTTSDFAHVCASFSKALAACGLVASDIVDQTTMYNWVIAASALDQALAKLGCCIVPGGVGKSERHLEVIRTLGVTAIVAFPDFLEQVLSLAAEAGCRLPIRKAVLMGELRGPDARERMLAEHGVRVRQFYGVADVGAVAWECQAGQGMHLRDDLLVEFLDPQGSEALTPAPSRPAEIVVTDLRRQAMPIIRLRTGDMVDELLTGTCRCGRSSPRFTRLVGRASESARASLRVKEPSPAG